jgi:hypothetical protein
MDPYITALHKIITAYKFASGEHLQGALLAQAVEAEAATLLSTLAPK